MWNVKHILCVELQHYVVIIVGSVDPDDNDFASLDMLILLIKLVSLFFSP